MLYYAKRQILFSIHSSSVHYACIPVILPLAASNKINVQIFKVFWDIEFLIFGTAPSHPSISFAL